MNEEDERGAQKVAVMIVSMLLFATALVCFSVSIFDSEQNGKICGCVSNIRTILFDSITASNLFLFAFIVLQNL